MVAARGRRRGAGRRSSRATSAGPYVLGGLYNGVDTPEVRPDRLTSTPARARSTGGRWCPAAGTGSTCSTRTGSTEGVAIAHRRREAAARARRRPARTITVHSDGTVTIEGKNGVTVDAGTGSLELKGGEISLKATNGVTVDGGGGAVKVSAARAEPHGMTAKLEGSGADRGQRRRDLHDHRPAWSRSTDRPRARRTRCHQQRESATRPGTRA